VKRLLSTILALLSLTVLAANQQRPNVVVIVADDLGWADLGAYGSTFHQTPRLDRLAREGLRFSNAYAACPVCSPTRAALMTGRYPARVGITDYIGGQRAGRLKPAPYLDHLPLEETTVAEAFKDASYVTAFVGKWHLGGTNYYPTRQGFDVNIAGSAQGHPPSYFSPYKIPTLPDGPPGEYLTDRLTDEAMKFISTNRSRPFLLWLSHYAVHTPLQAKPELLEKYRAALAQLPAAGEAEFRPEGECRDRRLQRVPVYAAMLESLDQSVGRILDTLAQFGLDERTIVVFTSDNGGLSTSEGSPTSNAPWRAGKGWLYEGGVRVPLLVKWPGVTKPGATNGTPAISMDLFPTLLEAVGLPARPQAHVDGVSLVPVLRGGQLPPRPLFWHYPHYGNQGGAPSGSLRAGDWKLIEWFEDGRVELFNLQTDFVEQNNLAGKDPEKVKALQAGLAQWRKDVGARMPTPNPDPPRASQK
jgi:arylsulfatase A-like enzyme